MRTVLPLPADPVADGAAHDELAITPARHEGGAAVGRERCLGSAGTIPLLEPDRLTCRVQSKDLPTGLVVGHSWSVVVAEAEEAVGLVGDDRDRYERTDARLAPNKREPLAASVAAIEEPTGVPAKL